MSEVRKAKVRSEVHAAHAAVVEAIERGQIGRLRSLEQLQVIERELRRMLVALDSGDIPSRDERSPGLWHIVTDSWSPTDPLGEKIVAAELAYEKL